MFLFHASFQVWTNWKRINPISYDIRLRCIHFYCLQEVRKFFYQLHADLLYNTDRNIWWKWLFKKKMDRTGPWTVPSRGGPAPGGQRWDGFGFFEFGPSWTGPCEPCGTVDHAGPWTGPARTGPSSIL
jgi:hypothetical protein